MIDFTHNNHLKYYIGERLYSTRMTEIEKFRISVGKIDNDQYASSNYNDELLRIAHLVYKQLGKDCTLFLSGGTDSEIVLRNLVSIGIKPTCHTIRFENEYNLHDVKESTEITNELGVKLNIIDFNIKNFFYSGEAAELAAQLQCSQIAYLAVCKNIISLGGTPAIMGGELMLQRNIHTNPSTWNYAFRENEDAALFRCSMIYDIPIVNEWFSYTPEIMLYYLENADIINLVTDKFNYKLSSVSSKNTILKKLIPDTRFKLKTHGFEKLLAFNFEVGRKLKPLMIPRLESSLDGLEYNKVVNMLKGNNGSN